MAKGEVDAVVLVLRLMYGGELPPAYEDDVKMLASAYAASDRYLAHRSRDVLAEAVRRLDIKYLEPLELSVMLNIPEHLPHMDLIRTKCMKRLLQLFRGLGPRTNQTELGRHLRICLMQLFGDVPSVINSIDRMQRFTSLPFPAVLAWLKDDDLKVVCLGQHA